MATWWRRWRVEVSGILLLGLLLQLVWTLRLTAPTHMDAYYYTTNGQRLARGQGWTEEVIWQFLDEPAGLPVASHSYWMPLASLLAAPGYALCRCFRGAQLPFYLLTATLPLLAYAISWWLYGQRWQARLAALLTASGGLFAALWNQPETFAPFAWAGALCLLAQAKGAAAAGPSRARWWALAGVMAGLAHLTRADGFLLVAAALVVWWAGRRERRDLAALLLAYGLVLLPWLLRSWLLWGRLLPGAGTQTLFLTTYDDLFAFGREFNLAGYLAWGWGNILASKFNGVLIGLLTLLGVGGLVFLAPLFLAEMWRGRRDEDRRLLPLTVYLGLLLAVMGLLFTFPALRGGLFHSFSALWPWFMALAPAGLARAVGWVAARRPTWQPAAATRFFAVGCAGLVLLLTFYWGFSDSSNDTIVVDYYRAIGANLPVGAVVMVRNPPGYYYYTGQPAISVPNEGPEGVLAAGRAYGVTHLILDQHRPGPLADLYQAAAPPWPIVWQGDGVKVYALPAAGEGGGD